MTQIPNQPAVCDKPCSGGVFSGNGHPRLIVVTGGPGAGKTAVLEIIRKDLCEHVVILPEAASIVFGGGFWRLNTAVGVRASQRAILHIQQELESIVEGERKWPVCLCDRGVLDGLAYWQGDEADFWAAAQSSLAAEYARYHCVIHLRTPTEEHGYNHDNPLRVETASQAALIDEKIHKIWSGHPRYHMINSHPDFLVKAETAVRHIIQELPPICARVASADAA